MSQDVPIRIDNNQLLSFPEPDLLVQGKLNNFQYELEQLVTCQEKPVCHLSRLHSLSFIKISS